MKTEQIERAIKSAAAECLSVEKFGSRLAGAPYNLIPPDATKVMDEYRKRFPKLTTNRAILPGLVAQVAAVVSKSPEVSEESNYQPSILNRSAVKAYALAVAKEKRAGKFNRVSVDFLKGVEAEVEALIRGTGGAAPDEDTDGEWDFLNRKQVRPKIEEQLNLAVRKIILRKIKSHPSLGKTLK